MNLAGDTLAAGARDVHGAGRMMEPERAGAAWGIIDPDYARVYTQGRIIAWQYGFALMMHGSFTRDLDLLLVPWEERAYAGIVDPIIKQLCAACDLRIVGEPGVKPHGRMAYTLLFSGFEDRRWVDLSVMPCQKATP